MSRTTPFERIVTSKPIDKLAAMQAARGVEWHPDYRGNPHARRWDILPQNLLKPVPTHKPTFVDHTGTKFGRFTVVGYLGKLNPKKKAVWLCRCDCGKFETRGGQAILSAAPTYDCCEDCRYLERVKRGEGNSPFAERANRPTLVWGKGEVKDE